ncbi:MAG: ATP-binding cassette domain-containing protein [Gorillibacterium sp.]|nr:ATP-binding cassette domain-containing protein [Gorillibacterium sp.]
MADIVLKQVCKTFGNETVVRNLDLTIRDGSFTVLVGPSGCGKSTTLRMIAGLEKQSSGDILIAGRSVNETEPGKRNVAMVFQNYALYPTMTVRGNIEFGLKNRKMPKSERVRVIGDIADTVGLTPYLDKKPQSLSGGQRQRVALARAMVKEPAVFLMDEPLSNLDAKLRSQMRTELIQLHQRLKTTFVYVTHDQVEAMSMGDEIVIMEGGHIRQAGAPMHIYHDPSNLFTARFIGTPAMNALESKRLPLLPFEAAIPIQHVGFRPENAMFASEHTLSGLFIPAEIITRETLGAEIVYRMSSASGDFFVKTFLQPMEASSKVYISVPYEQLYFFDSNGERIRQVNPLSTSVDGQLGKENHPANKTVESNFVRTAEQRLGAAQWDQTPTAAALSGGKS